MIFATAGHVDHGKTSLVRAITGVDTDRLIEEKKRGLSIDLGFAYLPIEDGPTIGFVDVPGHKRFVGNMMAGISGIDAALIVIAADDGLMPQTYEHLTILNLIGVNRGLVAITKCDLVAQNRTKVVAKMVRETLTGTELAGASIIPVSTVTGEGIQKLNDQIYSLCSSHTPKKADGKFRMTIDRAFQIKGSGVVITGTVTSGFVVAGDRLKLTPMGQPVRVRSVRAQNSLSDKGVTGERVGLNIVGPGVTPTLAGRGNWLVSETLHRPTKIIDTKLRLLDYKEKNLSRSRKVHLHIGAARLTANINFIDRENFGRNGSGYAQLNLDYPISALYGDRFILRDSSATHTIGGGYIIDPLATPRGRSRPERIQKLQALDQPHPKKALKEYLKLSNRGVNLTSFVLSRNLFPDKTTKTFLDVYSHSITTKFGQIIFSAGDWQSMVGHVRDMLKNKSALNEVEPGLTIAELQNSSPVRVYTEAIQSVVEELLKTGEVTFDGQFVRLPNDSRLKSSKDLQLINSVVELLKKKPSAPPATGPLSHQLSITPKTLLRILRLLESDRIVMCVVSNRYYLRSSIETFASAMVTDCLDINGKVQLANFRNATGLSRNLAIEVLEYFDNIGFTAREGDYRILLKPYSDLFPPHS